jgi:hypothetical protein
MAVDMTYRKTLFPELMSTLKAKDGAMFKLLQQLKGSWKVVLLL